MKTLKIIINLFFISLFTQAQTDVYLMRQPTLNSILNGAIHVRTTTGAWCANQDWNVPPGTHTFLEVAYCCSVLGANDLIIDTNSALGVVPDTCDDPPLELFIPEYIEFVLLDKCGNEITENYKQSFFLTSSFHFPYRLYNGQLQNIATPYEWAEVTKYGIPDTILGYVNYLNEGNPPYQEVITRGSGDCYGAGYYNNGLVMDNVPTKDYTLKVKINFPPNAQESGVYPNEQLYKVHYDAISKTLDTGWVEISATAVPSEPRNIKKISTPATIYPVIEWEAGTEQVIANLPCKYHIRRKLVTGNKEQQSNPYNIYSDTPDFTDIYAISNRFYRYYISSINSVGESLSVPSNKIKAP